MFEALKLLSPNKICKTLLANSGILIDNENKKSYKNDEILDIDDPYPKLKQLLKIEWNNTYITYNDYDVKYSIFNNNMNDKLICYKSDDIQYIILITSNLYIVLSSIYYNPKLDSNIFNYKNDDMLGYNLIEYCDDDEIFINNDYTLQKLLKCYYSFLCNIKI